MKDDILQAVDLRKSYLEGTPLEVHVLRGLTFTVPKGQFVAIVGQSGSGKSTLLNLLGLLDQPSSGRLYLDGMDTGTLNARELARTRNAKIGFVFQFHHLMSEFTCLENALMPIMIARGEVTSIEKDRVLALMQRVGLAGVTGKRANQVSGGQQQRVAIIRALANQPALVLADEPTGNLDSVNSREVFAMMREITAEFGVTFMMVTHDDRLATHADRIFHIADGQMTVSAGQGGVQGLTPSS